MNRIKTHFGFYVFTAVSIFFSISHKTPWPIVIWIIWVVYFPLQNWAEKYNRSIYAKYGPPVGYLTPDESKMLEIANEIANPHGLKAEFLMGEDGRPARKVCVVGDARKYNPICILVGPPLDQETLAEISVQISNNADMTCTYDLN